MAQITQSSVSSPLGFLERTYAFDLLLRRTGSSEPNRRIEIQLREGSPSYSAIGSQTWNSAPLMCRRLAGDPFEVFPQLLHPSPMSHDHPGEMLTSSPNLKTSRRSFRVLELGSGTGLVGLTASHVLASILPLLSPLLSFDVEVILTDYHPEVLKNLRYNLKLNQAGLSLPGNCHSSLTVNVMQLDWRKLKDSELTSAGLEGSFDVILGSDLVYEPEHAIWASNAVQYFLKPEIKSLDELSNNPNAAIPGTGEENTSVDPRPSFHLLLPLRPTFTKESEAVHYAFGGSDLKLLFDQTDHLLSTLPTHSCKWELSTNPAIDEEHETSNPNRLKIVSYSEEEGVKFGQGCGQYQYLQIRWA